MRNIKLDSMSAENTILCRHSKKCYCRLFLCQHPDDFILNSQQLICCGQICVQTIGKYLFRAEHCTELSWREQYQHMQHIIELQCNQWWLGYGSWAVLRGRWSWQRRGPWNQAMGLLPLMSGPLTLHSTKIIQSSLTHLK